MKKTICCIIALLLSISSAYAVGSETEKKNAFEFCDMYMHRIQRISNESGIDVTYDFSGFMDYRSLDYMDSLADSNQYFVEVPAGTLVVSVPDFCIEHVSTLYCSFSKSDEKTTKESLRSAMVFACLEYTSADDRLIEFFHKNDPSKPFSVEYEAFSTFAKSINKVLTDENLSRTLFAESGNTVPFYSGNYEYSLLFIAGDEEHPNLGTLYVLATKE